MNKQILTALGCSGSIALSLMGASTAEANTASKYVFTAPEIDRELTNIPSSEADYPFFDCSCSEYDAATVKEMDREGDKAIATFGCDCAGCRRLVRNLDKNDKIQPNIIE